MFNAASVSRFIRCLFFEAKIVHVLRRVSSSSFVDGELGEDGDEGDGVDEEEECDVNEVRRVCTCIRSFICSSAKRELSIERQRK